MHPKLLACLFSLFICSFTNCQIVTLTPKKTITNIYIVVDTGTGSSRGFVYNISDTAIQISPYKIPYKQFLEEFPLNTLNYYSIKDVKKIRKGSVLGCMLSGAVIGALIGKATQKPVGTGTFAPDFTPLAIVGGASIGIVTGALAGLFLKWRKFRIDKNKDKFEHFQHKMLKKIYVRKIYKESG